MKKLQNKFKTATDFSKGKAFVKVSGSETNFCITKNGNILFETEFEPYGGSFNDSNQTIIYNKESLCGIMNNQGKIIIPCEYDFIGQYSWGYTLERDNICKKIGFDGKTIFEPKTSSKIIPLANKYEREITVPNSIPQEINGKFGCIIVNPEYRKTLIPFEYEYLGNFLEFQLAEAKKNGKYGFINAQNEEIIPVEYNRVGSLGFRNGICLVEKNNKCGFIDKYNNFVIPLIYGSSSGEFCEDIACVEVIADDSPYYKYIHPNGENAF